MAVGLKTLLLCRFGLGISEAPCFPVNSRVVSAWFPQQERAKATAVYTVGSISGWPALRRCCSGSWTVSGWRVLFVSVGAVGILFALVWWRCYREPHEDPRLSQQEREHIKNGGGLSAPTDQQVAFQLAAGPPAAEQTADHRRQHRPVCRQYRAGVFSHLVPHLAGHRAAYALAEGWLLLHPAVCRRRRRGDVWRLALDKLLKATGSANLGRKLPDRCRPADGQLHHHRELAGERPGGDPW